MEPENTPPGRGKSSSKSSCSCSMFIFGGVTPISVWLNLHFHLSTIGFLGPPEMTRMSCASPVKRKKRLRLRYTSRSYRRTPWLPGSLICFAMWFAGFDQVRILGIDLKPTLLITGNP